MDNQVDKGDSTRQDAQLAQTVRPLQIIVASLLVGVLGFAVVAFFLGGNVEGDAARPPILTYVSMAFGALSIVLYFVVPSQVAARAGQRSQTETALASSASVFQTKTIVACALAEGAAIFALTAYVMEGNLLSYAVVAIMVLAILFQFPTESTVRHWCENQLLNRQP